MSAHFLVDDIWCRGNNNDILLREYQQHYQQLSSKVIQNFAFVANEVSRIRKTNHNLFLELQQKFKFTCSHRQILKFLTELFYKEKDEGELIPEKICYDDFFPSSLPLFESLLKLLSHDKILLYWTIVTILYPDTVCKLVVYPAITTLSKNINYVPKLHQLFNFFNRHTKLIRVTLDVKIFETFFSYPINLWTESTSSERELLLQINANEIFTVPYTLYKIEKYAQTMYFHKTNDTYYIHTLNGLNYNIYYIKDLIPAAINYILEVEWKKTFRDSYIITDCLYLNDLNLTLYPYYFRMSFLNTFLEKNNLILAHNARLINPTRIFWRNEELRDYISAEKSTSESFNLKALTATFFDEPHHYKFFIPQSQYTFNFVVGAYKETDEKVRLLVGFEERDNFYSFGVSTVTDKDFKDFKKFFIQKDDYPFQSSKFLNKYRFTHFPRSADHRVIVRSKIVQPGRSKLHTSGLSSKRIVVFYIDVNITAFTAEDVSKITI